MLDAYIIEQIRRRDEERRSVRERPMLELPLYPDYYPLDEEEDEREPERVIVIDL